MQRLTLFSDASVSLPEAACFALKAVLLMLVKFGALTIAVLNSFPAECEPTLCSFWKWKIFLYRQPAVYPQHFSLKDFK